MGVHRTPFLCLAFSLGLALAGPCRSEAAARISVDYPAPGALFPPDIAAPTILWRDPDPAALRWTMEVSFADGAAPLRFVSNGERRPIGEIDKRCADAGAVPPTLTPEEQAGHSWKPDETAWSAIKAHSVSKPARMAITGYRDAAMKYPVSRGTVELRTSRDRVGAPIFYRDVPLIPVPMGEKGVIMPLPAEAVPFIGWRLYDISQPKSRLMMEGLPTCANCHSFSADGKTLGIDVDGPQNDKGLYGIVPVRTHTSIRNDYVIRWSAFSETASKRFGFMSQVSPDGRYVITSIENPGTRVRGLDSRLYNGFYKDYGFGQVFFPTKGVLAWYSKATGKLQTLPGADDPRFVQSSAFWSPDGKYLIFSRAPAKEPYAEGQKNAEYANDPAETQIQYDLYRIPFNEGRGGVAEPVEGASRNGMSNNFPKVSPDGRWIVFVQNRNGLLMRPDSQLHIVPFGGGKARRLNSNTSRMNSWHSFSPNGRWMVFSSKGRSLYTQMYLTHIDEDGNDTPGILIENATAANRAVNIPEFVNVAPDAIASMDAPAVDFYRICDKAANLASKGSYDEAIAEWRKAVQLEPDDVKARYNLAVELHRKGDLNEAAAQYREALRIDTANSLAHTNLGIVLVGAGQLDEAIAHFEAALRIDPQDVHAEANMGAALFEKGRNEEAIEHCRKAIALNPEHSDALNVLGSALAKTGKLDEAAELLGKAVTLNPEYLEYRYNLGRIFAALHRFPDAIPHFEKAVELSGGREPMSLDMLAAMYSEVGRFDEAVATANKGLSLAMSAGNGGAIQLFRARVARYQAMASAATRK